MFVFFECQFRFRFEFTGGNFWLLDGGLALNLWRDVGKRFAWPAFKWDAQGCCQAGIREQFILTLFDNRSNKIWQLPIKPVNIVFRPS